MPLKLLAVGDLHLGRRPGGLPEFLRSPEASRPLSPAAALNHLVDTAIARSVDVVAFAGDVVEQEDDFFEAYGELRRAVQRLHAAGIKVAAVAGNHDVQVLPALADELADFRLLGRDGRWENLPLEGADGTGVNLCGWSFPSPVVRTSPLSGQSLPRDTGPTLGLLHCDRDQSSSPHAPVRSNELSDAGVDAWLLGHIHKPDALSVSNPMGYLGSVTPLRATETGAHGPWLVTVGPTGLDDLVQWPLAPLRWDSITVPIDNMSDAIAARSRMLDALKRHAQQVMAAEFQPEVLGVRIRFTGRSRLRSSIEELLSGENLDDVSVVDGLRCFVSRIEYDLRPEADLDELARRHDPVGLMAQRLLLIDQAPDNPQRQALLDDARRRLDDASTDRAWDVLPSPDWTDEALSDLLRETITGGLDALLRQREDDSA